MIYLIGASVCFLIMLFDIVYENKHYSTEEILGNCGGSIFIAAFSSMFFWYLIIPVYLFKLIVNIWDKNK